MTFMFLKSEKYTKFLKRLHKNPNFSKMVLLKYTKINQIYLSKMSNKFRRKNQKCIKAHMVQNLENKLKEFNTYKKLLMKL